MSEEFECKVKFKCDDVKAIELLQKVSSFFDEESYLEAEECMKQYEFTAPTERINKLMINSYHTNSLAETLAVCAEQSRAELGVKSEYGMSYLSALELNEKGEYEIFGSGVDREAHQFCKYIAIFIHALSNNDLTVIGGGSFWGGNWEISNGVLAEEFKAYEE